MAHLCQECGKKTKHGKPYCEDHIHMMFYAEGIQAAEVGMEEEVKAILKGEPVTPDSLVVNEIITALKVEGVFKQGELAKYLSIPLEAIIRYLAQMQDWGMVKLTKEKKTIYVEFISKSPTIPLSTRELANIIDLQPSSIHKLITKGAPHIRKGRFYFFREDEFKEWYATYKARVAAENVKKLEEMRLANEARVEEELKKLPRTTVHLKQLVDEMGLHESTIRKLVRKGAPHYLIDRNLFFSPAKFKRWYAGYRRRVSKANSRIRRRIQTQKAKQLRKDIKKEKGALLTRQELAKKLDVNASTVQYWVTKGVPHEEIDNPEYMGGKEGTKIRLFDLDQVIEWRKQFHEEAMEIRKTSQALGDEFWNAAIQFALDNSVAEATEKYGVARGTLTRKMREAGVETPGIVPVSERTLTRFEAAPILGVKPVTIYKWVNEMGAPHDRVAHPNVKNRETILINVDELREWKKHEDSKALKRKRDRRYRQHAKILEFLAATGPTSARQIALNTDMGPDKAKLRLAELVDLGKVIKTGVQASTKYSLPEHSQRRNPDTEFERLKRLYAQTNDYEALLKLRHHSDQRGICLHERTRCSHRILSPRETDGSQIQKTCSTCSGSGQVRSIPGISRRGPCAACAGSGSRDDLNYMPLLWTLKCTRCNDILQQEQVSVRRPWTEARRASTKPGWCASKRPRMRCEKCHRELRTGDIYCEACAFMNSRVPDYCNAAWGCAGIPVFTCNCGEAICVDHGPDDDHVCF
jgi:phage terminase Nu1 subunit (DNA packaging protein)/predicted ArsR family transcriptional regulator